MFRFAGRLFAARFFTPMFLPIFGVAGRFTRIFRTPFPLRLMAGGLDTAQGAPEIFDLPFIANLLFFRSLNQFQNVFHLFQGVFEGFHNPPHIIHSVGERRTSGRFMTGPFSRRSIEGPLLRLRPLDGWRSIGGFWFRLRPFNGRRINDSLWMRLFLGRRRCVTGGGRRSGTRWCGGLSWTHAASSTATATTSATG
jgi:hypothetical protein